MKRSFATIVLIPVICLLVVSNGCQLFDPGANFKKGGGKGPKSLVWKDTFCIEFTEFRTSSSFATSLVASQLKTDIIAKLQKDGVLDRIDNIRMSGGSVRLVGKVDHDWDITSRVDIKRTDIVDGPRTLVNESTVSLKGLKKAENVDLNNTGVNIVNRALEELVAGGNPVLVVDMVGSSVAPEPSVSDPLEFTWRACIEVLATLNP